MGFDMATLTMAVIAMAVPFLARTARADVPYYTDRESYQGAVFGQVPVQTFHSSDLQAPIYQINYWDAERIDMSAPYLFMSGNYGGWGPSIVSSKDLSLVWGDEGGKIVTQATTTGRLNGEQVLITCRDWHIQIFDQAYNRIHTIEPRGDLSGLRLDCHESSFTHDGTVVMIVCPAKRADLRGLGGIEDGRVLDCTVQEQDPITDEVLFEFSTLSYFGPEDSFADLTDAEYWDFAHMNSVEKVGQL